MDVFTVVAGFSVTAAMAEPAILWSTWLQLKNKPARTINCDILTEYKRELAAPAFALRLASETFGGPLPFSSFHQPDLPILDILFSSKRQVTHCTGIF
ncbi:hypothetical protein EVAR_66239_1 [Eumeta japonica]|uniref:Uncharacterized protein n=1 Tax=Eumeta variegata TaxID=151549 RepID=A0A4C1ZY99_EUMVA|nr:hypothetical protein EVAR_66239_1 [Eumeta japonica]